MMHEPASASTSRPHTPESSWTSSLQDASATIDDLTVALANFSRVPSPQLTSSLICCCGQEDCENHQAWSAFRAKLESRLILSAEVGQALLQRHEAYVRQHERRSTGKDMDTQQLSDEVRELRAHNSTLQKRLSQALVNSEVVENSNKVVHQELHEARMNLTRLAAQQVRAAGLESRLTAITQEKEDIQQERDNADQRAKLAESRIVALRDRCSKMQDQLSGLHRDLQEQRSQRLELSQEILEDARKRLKELQHPPHDQQPLYQDEEVIKMVESLVLSNETLKRDNGEMQRLLSESQEDSRALQDELQELRASENRRYTRHRFASSLSIRSPSLSPMLSSPVGFSPLGRRAVSVERGIRRGFEPLTPETTSCPLSPLTPSVCSGNMDDPVTSSRIYVELDEESQRENQPRSPERTRSSQRPLLLLTRSRAVQTEPWKGSLAPSPRSALLESSPSSHDGKSEVSSLTDAQPSPISALLERATSLLGRLISSDALTLTNRLKRQHLTGADVGHLSRTTVRTIISEATMLRTNFRTLLEDEHTTATLTRKDLRALFKLLRDAIAEMGDLRITLNDIILDPSIASKVSNMILNPSKSAESGPSSASGWIAPIAKLFGGATDDGATSRAVPLPAQSATRGRQAAPLLPPQRLIPKLEPALSAYAMTVNVEFHTTGVGRAVTSTHSAHPSRENEGSGSRYLARHDNNGSVRQLKPSSSIMGIFAGAPVPADTRDPWIVVPKPQRKPLSPFDEAQSAAIENGLATIGRSSMRIVPDADKLSRTVDAVIDVESNTGKIDPSPGFQTTLLQRTLRPRGLSDSSIRTTFTQHGGSEGEGQLYVPTCGRQPEETLGSSVLAALSKKVFSFKSASSTLVDKSISRSSTPKLQQKSERATATRDDNDGDVDDFRYGSPPARGRFFPGLSSWSAAFEPGGFDHHNPYAGSPRDDWLSAREAHGRDF